MRWCWRKINKLVYIYYTYLIVSLSLSGLSQCIIKYKCNITETENKYSYFRSKQAIVFSFIPLLNYSSLFFSKKIIKIARARFIKVNFHLSLIHSLSAHYEFIFIFTVSSLWWTRALFVELKFSWDTLDFRLISHLASSPRHLNSNHRQQTFLPFHLLHLIIMHLTDYSDYSFIIIRHSTTNYSQYH